MDYTQQQMVEFKQSYGLKRRRQIILIFPVVLCMLVLVSSEKEPASILGLSPQIVLPIIFGLLICAVGYSFYNWRCPACNKYLGKAINPSFCSKCGVALR